MPPNIDEIWVFRMISIQNLMHDLQNGLYSKNTSVPNPAYIGIGSQEIIGRRDVVHVKCYPQTVVNDYVPFYFSVRTPMLFNIKTGMGVPATPQDDIVYLCCRLTSLTTTDFQWCFTEGNAAKAITQFFIDLKDLDKLDWTSIITHDFQNYNADGDEDRVRKKHAEFLVKDHLPTRYIQAIVVKTCAVQVGIKELLNQLSLNIPIHINPKQKFYFL